MTEHAAPSERTTLKRLADRARYGRDEIKELLASGIIAHVGVSTDAGPIVLPMAYGVRDDEILIHGGAANALLRSGRSTDVCITVTIVDGLIIARTPLHNSMNYRSIVIRGEATSITDPAKKEAALRVINDHVVAIWDTARPPAEVDYKQTLVLSVPLTEASAKVRSGDPSDDPDDMVGPHWAGVLPLHTSWGEPKPADDLIDGIEIPAAVAEMGGSNAHPNG